MKNIILIIIVLQSFFAIGQEAPKMPKYIAKNEANIFYYDLDEVVEKAKIKKEKTESLTKKELRIYNNKIKDISFLNFQKLNELDLVVNSIGEKARSSSDRDLILKIRKQIQETITPIRDSINKNEKILNTSLKNILSKKQFKKFIKHQKNKKKSLRPKPPQSQNQNNTRPMRSNRGRRGGMMGNGYY